MLDPEIEAMSKCFELFTPLEDESKVRVIQWLISKFQLNSQGTFIGKTKAQVILEPEDEVIELPPTNGKPKEVDEITVLPKSISGYDTVADFFAACSPSADWEKALVVAAFLQVKNSLSDFTSFEINKQLKDLGHASANITIALTNCIDRKPQLIIQTRKDGKTQQAKKKYKVSGEGIKHANELLLKKPNE